MKSALIEAKNLTKKYNGFIAVDDISFDVNKGEIFGFLGPNGAGKTTTINMLIGMAKITSGNVVYKGEDFTQNTKRFQGIIGVVVDESNLYDEMTGFDNLCFCGSLYGLSKKVREQRASELLDTFRLTDAANKKFKAYSKGMKRKLTIAAALIHKPEILFLDEPTTGIDVMSTRHIQEIIKDLNKEGTTIFLTTHYIEEAEILCDRVAFINNGKILKIDTVNKLLEDMQESNIVEVEIESLNLDKELLVKKLNHQFPGVECIVKNAKVIKIISTDKMDIAPIVNSLSKENIKILEARLLKPSLEDVFIKITGLDIELMKKEKDKK